MTWNILEYIKKRQPHHRQQTERRIFEKAKILAGTNGEKTTRTNPKINHQIQRRNANTSTYLISNLFFFLNKCLLYFGVSWHLYTLHCGFHCLCHIRFVAFKAAIWRAILFLSSPSSATESARPVYMRVATRIWNIRKWQICNVYLCLSFDPII